ncbi:MAG: AmmeMemoRadiSam system radical SAM enzyme [Planctomycetota bacterium]
MKEAMLYDKLDDDRVKCRLCSHRCTIAPGKLGICQARRNDGGTLVTMAYGRTIAQHVDPIEKKPLYHFRPGSTAFSIATPGCNFRCGWCQNADISQTPSPEDFLGGRPASPEHIVAAARRAECLSIAYTYTEPTIFFEYAYDTARLAHDAGLANLFVTNGYMTQETLETIRPYLDAANVDLKAFREETYQAHVGARLEPVLENLKVFKRLGIWLEVTTLIIPDINDDEAELRDCATFLAREVGSETPWHLSRFRPAFKMTHLPPTPMATLTRAREIGLQAGLRHVYLGNAPGQSDTTCYQCDRLLIRRTGFGLAENSIRRDGTCPDCGTRIAGVGIGVEGTMR